MSEAHKMRCIQNCKNLGDSAATSEDWKLNKTVQKKFNIDKRKQGHERGSSKKRGGKKNVKYQEQARPWVRPTHLQPLFSRGKIETHCGVQRRWLLLLRPTGVCVCVCVCVCLCVFVWCACVCYTRCGVQRRTHIHTHSHTHTHTHMIAKSFAIMSK